MSRFNIASTRYRPKGWQEILVDRINKGKVLPLISNIVSHELVFDAHETVIKRWASDMGYPHDDRDNLQRILQFHHVNFRADPAANADNDYIRWVYLDFLSDVLRTTADQTLLDALENHADQTSLSFSEQAARLETPSAQDSQLNPLLLLANLPLPVYLTTSYHTFVEAALIRAGKEPQTAVCAWNGRPATFPDPFDDASYEPTPEQPLVYHLHGLDSDPASLVLTEDDYLDFLVAVARDPKLIPYRVSQALADSALILLGYSLSDWDFRVLFRGLIKPINTPRPKSIYVQLEDNDAERNRYVKNYLHQEADFTVYWGTMAAFLQEIYHKWEET